MPLIRIARLGSRPMMIGNTNVAPNIATTCWAPMPTVLPHMSRWSGATGCPGAGSTTVHLNIDMTYLLVRAPSPSARTDALMTHLQGVLVRHLTVTDR